MAEHRGVFFDWKRGALGRGAKALLCFEFQKLQSLSILIFHALQLAASIDVFTIDNLNVEIDDGSLDGIVPHLRGHSSLSHGAQRLTHISLQRLHSS